MSAMLTNLLQWEGRIRYRTVALRHRSTMQQLHELRTVFYEQFWRDAAADLGAELESPGYGFLRLRRGGVQTLVYGANVMLDDHVTLEIAANKALTHELLKNDGLPVPRYVVYQIDDLTGVHELLEETGRIVIKPVTGNGGYGVTAEITEHAQVLSASRVALAFGKQLLAEEQVEGESYRMLYLDNELIDVVHRGPPSVIGDGRHSLQDLIQLENRRRLAGKPIIALSPLVADRSVHYYLNGKGMTLRTRPAEGEVTVLKSVVNQNASRENLSVLSKIHPSYSELGRRISRLVPIRLLGLDVIVPRVDKPLSSSNGVIHELNTTPAFHHHALIANREQQVPVGSRVLTTLLGTPSMPC